MFESNNLPVHSEQMISYPYGIADSSYSCGWHTGVDIVPHGDTENNPKLFSVRDNCEIINVNNNPDNALGCYVLLFDGEYYWRYCHMVEDSIQVAPHDVVDKNTVLGRMGATGNVTGRHLHLECSISAVWTCDGFRNPCTILGIPNVDDFVMNWTEKEPEKKVKRKKFKWVLFNKKNQKRGYS